MHQSKQTGHRRWCLRKNEFHFQFDWELLGANDIWRVLDEMCRDSTAVCCSRGTAEHLMNLCSSQQTQSRIASMWSPSIFHYSGQIHLSFSVLSLSSVSLWISYLFHFPWCLFSCISQEWSHYLFSSSHAVNSTKCQAFALKGNLTQTWDAVSTLMHFSFLTREFEFSFDSGCLFSNTEFLNAWSQLNFKDVICLFNTSSRCYNLLKI